MDDKLLEKENYLPNKGDLIVTKIHFGKKDGELTKWVQSIPKGRFSIIVKDALRAFIQNDESYKLPTYPPIAEPKEVVLKSLSIGKGDYDIYIHLYSIQRYMRANHIKAVLNHFLKGTPVEATVTTPKQQQSKTVPLISTQAERSKAQNKEVTDRAMKNKLKLIQLSKMMNSEAYGQD